AVDIFIGSNALPDDDPRNRVYPGEFNYGGGHVIEELVAGKDIKLVATAYGTDCYPRRRLETWINIEDLNQAVLFNIRNAYQNYSFAFFYLLVYFAYCFCHIIKMIILNLWFVNLKVHLVIGYNQL
ncbi:unnamed protein product, partial [marine sediment metagenome]